MLVTLWNRAVQLLNVLPSLKWCVCSPEGPLTTRGLCSLGCWRLLGALFWGMGWFLFFLDKSDVLHQNLVGGFSWMQVDGNHLSPEGNKSSVCSWIFLGFLSILVGKLHSSFSLVKPPFLGTFISGVGTVNVGSVLCAPNSTGVCTQWPDCF